MPAFLIIVAIAVIAVLVFGFSTSLIGYGLLKTTAKFGSSASAPPQQPQPWSSGWAIQYSKNVPTQMTQASDGTFFVDLPSQNGLHYVVENASGKGLAIGKIITMVYSVTGTGTVLAVNEQNVPGGVHLYMQRNGDDMSGAGAMQQYRYWGHPSGDLTAGDYTISVPVVAASWSDVMGAYGNDHPNGFADCVANAQAIGFTFGGKGSGHGVYVSNGTARFTLKSFTIS